MKRVLERVALMVLISSPVLAGDATVAEGYKLQPGDVLQVNVWKETELQSEVLIRPDGGISFALAGDLQAAGLTTDELRGQLELRVRRLVPGAVVTVSVTVHCTGGARGLLRPLIPLRSRRVPWGPVCDPSPPVACKLGSGSSASATWKSIRNIQMAHLGTPSRAAATPAGVASRAGC